MDMRRDIQTTGAKYNKVKNLCNNHTGCGRFMQSMSAFGSQIKGVLQDSLFDPLDFNHLRVQKCLSTAVKQTVGECS